MKTTNPANADRSQQLDSTKTGVDQELYETQGASAERWSMYDPAVTHTYSVRLSSGGKEDALLDVEAGGPASAATAGYLGMYSAPPTAVEATLIHDTQPGASFFRITADDGTVFIARVHAAE